MRAGANRQCSQLIGTAGQPFSLASPWELLLYELELSHIAYLRLRSEQVLGVLSVLQRQPVFNTCGVIG